MIPRGHITAWRSHAPWQQDAQVEQDLVISRAVVELFSDSELQRSLAFRGGTALYKLFLLPAARYSEDIDLVQIEAQPIGATLDRIRAVLDPWLGDPRRQQKEGRVNLAYRFDSEDTPPLRLRLKIEINSREHFSELGFASVPFALENPWFTGGGLVTTYDIHELLATKLRALFQASKGRDLFDLWWAMEQLDLDVPKLLRCFQRYMAEGGHRVTRARFEENLHGKARSADFRYGLRALLRPDVGWDFDRAMEAVLQVLVAALPGDPWTLGGDG